MTMGVVIELETQRVSLGSRLVGFSNQQFEKASWMEMM